MVREGNTEERGQIVEIGADQIIESSVILRAEHVRHGFFTRKGGISSGLHASLNCGYGSDDSRDDVAQNRAFCATKLGVAPESLVTAYQVHGVAVVEVDRPWLPAEAPRADALVTTRPGIALGILTADCAPILAADHKAGIVGAAHAGWKGAKAGVAEALIDAMVKHGAEPSRITAAVGPCIGPASYEVGPEFRDDFLADDPDAERFFTIGPSARPHFDLQAYVAARLATAGVMQLDRIAADTCAEADRFFSYRRSRLKGEPDYGRQLSAIALLPDFHFPD
jgi:YfiH family protein